MKKILSTLNRQTQAIPPIWLMRQAGRYLHEYKATRAEAGSFLDLCYNPTHATEVTMQPIRRYGFDAAILFSDILVVPQALGQDLTFAENHGPLLGEIPDTLNFNESMFHVNLLPVYETVSSIRAQLTKEGFNDTALIGFSGAPWTLACYMIDKKGSKDFAQTRITALTQQDYFKNIIDILTEAVSSYLIKQIDHGAEIIQLFDSWAGVLPPSEYIEWVVKPTARIVKNIRSTYPDTPIIGFPKGCGMMLDSYIAETGVTAVGLDAQTPLDKALSQVPENIILQGNLDPFTLVAGGTKMEEEIDKIMDAMKGRLFIFNLGHGIDKSTNPEHVKHLVDYIRARK